MRAIIRYYSFVLTLLLLLPGLLPQPAAALLEEYREPKNVVLSSLMGGISHIKGAFEVAVILRSRGHNITYITTDDQVKLAKPYGFPTISIGLRSLDPTAERNLMQRMLKNRQESMNMAIFGDLKKNVIDANYEYEYLQYKKIFAEIKPDVVVCDIFATACVDASFMEGIPFVLLEMMIISSGNNFSFIVSRLCDFERTFVSKRILLFQRLLLHTSIL